jgi:hypothetical protein
VYLYPLVIPSYRPVTGPISTLPKYTLCSSVSVYNSFTLVHFLFTTRSRYSSLRLHFVFHFLFTTRSRYSFTLLTFSSLTYLQHTDDYCRYTAVIYGSIFTPIYCSIIVSLQCSILPES